MPKPRNYALEYRRDQSSPTDIKHRSERNKARRLLSKMGLVHKGDGREVDHKRPLDKGGSNARSNLRAISRHLNRVKGDKYK